MISYIVSHIGETMMARNFKIEPHETILDIGKRQKVSNY
jgi:hypothetical protein